MRCLPRLADRTGLRSVCGALCPTRIALPDLRPARAGRYHVLWAVSAQASCGGCLPGSGCLRLSLVRTDHLFKFNSDPGWASTFATLLRSTPWVEPALENADLVLPLPLSRQRLQTRGFNQALALARALKPDKADAHVLLRIKDTPAQSSLNREERLASVKDAFALDPLLAPRIKGKRLVLVDDVMTSGASLYAAASALRSAGAAHITGMVIARTE